MVMLSIIMNDIFGPRIYWNQVASYLAENNKNIPGALERLRYGLDQLGPAHHIAFSLKNGLFKGCPIILKRHWNIQLFLSFDTYRKEVLEL